jgi:hypothetical protein
MNVIVDILDLAKSGLGVPSLRCTWQQLLPGSSHELAATQLSVFLKDLWERPLGVMPSPSSLVCSKWSF